MLNAIPKKALLIAIALFFTVLSAGGARANGAGGSSIYISPDWCAVGGSVNIRWQIDGGAPPYTVSVAGIVAETDDEYLSLSCADLRAWVTDGVLRQHVEVALPVRVVDANETEAAARLTLLLLAAAPQDVPQDIDLFVGYSDVHVRKPSFMPATEWRLVPSVVLIRYRPLDAVAWAYAMPFPWGPQSGRYALPSHISNLIPGTLYELQAAWVWFLGSRASSPGVNGFANIGPWDATTTGWWEEQGADRWWRKWNDAQEIRWSETLQFRPGGVRQLTVRSQTDLMIACWESAFGYEYLVARSDDWPGVIWANNAFEREQNEWSQFCPNSTGMSGMVALPADTQFQISLLRILPEGFVSPPIGRARVATGPAEPGSPPRLANPADIVVTAGLDHVTVAWTPDEQIATSVRLTTTGRQFPQPPTNHRQLADGRFERTFAGLKRGSTQRLYINRQSAERGGPFPFMCAVWDVQLRSANPEAYLDRYLASARRGDEPVARPVQMPQLTAGEFPYLPDCDFVWRTSE